MTTSLFENTDTTASSFDIEAIMQQLMQQTGCSAQEAADAVARQLAKRSQAKQAPQETYSSLYGREAQADYMRRIRESTNTEYFMTPAMKDIQRGDVAVAEAQVQFAENMKNKARGNTNANAIDFFRNARSED